MSLWKKDKGNKCSFCNDTETDTGCTCDLVNRIIRTHKTAYEWRLQTKKNAYVLKEGENSIEISDVTKLCTISLSNNTEGGACYLTAVLDNPLSHSIEINGKKVVKKAELKEDDIIQIGKLQFRLMRRSLVILLY